MAQRQPATLKNKKQTNKTKQKPANPVEKRESHLQSCHIIIFILFTFKYTLQQSKKYKSIETVLEKGLMADQLDKGFNITIIKLIKKLKEDVEK